MVQTVADVALTGLVCTAAWLDLTTQRIPNWLSVTGLAAALVLRASLGLDPLVHGVKGLGFALAVSLVLYALRAIGGGDVKLLAAVGTFFGFPSILAAFAIIALVGGALALASVVRQRVLPMLILNTIDLVKSWRTAGRMGQLRTLDTPGALTMPYGVPIALGTLIWWFGEGVRL